jgi:Zinc-finger of the MIZ type in Nse subunit
MSQRDFGGLNNAAVVTNVLNSIASKESSYKAPIKANHVLAKSAAKRIRHYEEILAKTIGVVHTEEEWKSYLKERKEELKSIAASNVTSQRKIDTFCKAVRNVQTQTQQTAQSQSAENSKENEEMESYEILIHEAIKAIETQDAPLQLDMEQEPFYREIAQLLGEPLAAAKKKTGDDDDDIEISEPLGATDGVSSLKCPITGAFMEDAVRNKVCSHVYSKAGILAHIQSQGRSHQCKCPMAGCGNRSVSEAQLEEDIETKMNVRRAMRQESQRLEQQASQANDLIDSDEE